MKLARMRSFWGRGRGRCGDGSCSDMYGACAAAAAGSNVDEGGGETSRGSGGGGPCGRGGKFGVVRERGGLVFTKSSVRKAIAGKMMKKIPNCCASSAMLRAPIS